MAFSTPPEADGAERAQGVSRRHLRGGRGFGGGLTAALRLPSRGGDGDRPDLVSQAALGRPD
jgi:hypothetical protein